MKRIDMVRLEEYVQIEGTEIADYLSNLLELRGFSESYGMTQGFSAAIDKELMHWLEKFKTQAEIVTTKEIIEITHNELVWSDNDYDSPLDA